MNEDEIKKMAEEAPKIDLSKLKNVDAVKTFEPGIEKLAEDAKKFKPKGKKFNFRSPELIPLPSHGTLYHTSDEDIRSGFIRLLPMSLREEEILTTSRFLRSGSATKMVLENCIVSDIDADEILLFDSNYLLFRLRQLSYGDDYKFTLKCDNPDCKREFTHSLKISELKFNELPEDIVEPIEVKLPVSKYTVKFILGRLRHSEELFKLSAKEKNEDIDRTRLRNLLVTTISILDDEGNPVNPSDWAEFYESIPGMDRAALTDKSKYDTGIDKLEGVSCPHCDTEFSGSIPVGIEFFRL